MMEYEKQARNEERLQKLSDNGENENQEEPKLYEGEP